VSAAANEVLRVVADGRPAGIAALVAFGLPARVVDGLIEELLGSAVEPARWFVFDADMEAMGALNEIWHGAVDIVLSCIPSVGSSVVDATLEILLLEGVPLDRCAWINGTLPHVEEPAGVGLVQ
jgi:hypothetical protein